MSVKALLEQTGPVRILHGEDAFAIDDQIEQWRAVFEAGNFPEMNIERFYGEERGADEMMVACNSMPAFAEGRLVVWRGHSKAQSSKVLGKLTAEVLADDGPGSKNWQAEGSQTKRINELFMQALRENNGKVPGELADVPGLIITTTGAKSGEKRAVPLAYQLIDDRLVIIASMGGAKRNPPWYYNLVKNPEVLVEKDGESYLAEAIVTSGADRDYLYKQVCAGIPVFAEYQARTTRTIPVVELKRK